MELVLKNTTLKFVYHPLTWVTQTFDPANILSTFIYQGKWNGGNGTCYLITRLDNMRKLRIQSNQSKNAAIAFLKSDAHVSGTAPDFCDTIGLVSVPLGGNEITFDIPEDCNCIYVLDGTQASGVGGHLPKLVEIGEYQ